MQKPAQSLRRLLYTQRGNRLLAPLFPLLGLLCGLFLKYGSRLLPNCLFYDLFHLHCPGCGGVRATLSLLRADIPSAFYYNPLLVCFYAFLLAWYLLFVYNAFFRKNYRPPFRFRPWHGFAALGVVLTYWVVRNLPFYTTVFF